MKNSFEKGYAEDLNKKTQEAQDKIRGGGEEALDAHFELQKLATEAENLKVEATFEKDDLDVSEEVLKSFIEGRAERVKLEIGGKTGAEYMEEFNKTNVSIDLNVQPLIDNMSTSSKNRESRDFIRLSPKDMGLKYYMNGVKITKEIICERAKELNLKLPPIEAGLEYRLMTIASGEIYNSESMTNIPIDGSDDVLSNCKMGQRPELMLNCFLGEDEKWLFELKKKQKKD